MQNFFKNRTISAEQVSLGSLEEKWNSQAPVEAALRVC